MTLTSLILMNVVLGTAVVYGIVRLLAAGIRAGAPMPRHDGRTLDELRTDAAPDRIAA
jgi:hypothetical protein